MNNVCQQIRKNKREGLANLTKMNEAIERNDPQGFVKATFDNVVNDERKVVDMFERKATRLTGIPVID